MDNILYQSLIVPSIEATDGETPTKIVVTQEVNCVAVWETSADDDEMIAHYRAYQRDEAIEFAVEQAGRMKFERSKKAA